MNGERAIALRHASEGPEAAEEQRRRAPDPLYSSPREGQVYPRRARYALPTR